MTKEPDNFKLGMTVIAMVALVVTVTLFIGQGCYRSTAPLVIRFPSDSALPYLKEGSPIRYGGQNVGKIDSITLTDVPGADGVSVPTTEVLARVDSALDLRADCRVVAVGPLLGGPAVLEIRSRGTSDQRPGGDTPVVGEAGGISAGLAGITRELSADTPGSLMGMIKSQLDGERADSLVTNLASTLADLRVAVANIRAQTEPGQRDALLGRLHALLDNLARVVANLREETERTNDASVVARLASGIDRLNGVLEDISDVLDENRSDVRATVGDLRQTSRTLATRVVAPLADELDRANEAGLLARVDRVFDRLDQTMASVEALTGKAEQTVALNQSDINRTIENLKEMSDHLRTTAKDLKRNPWRLLYRPTLQASAELNMFDAAREFAEASGRIDDALARLESLTAATTAPIRSDDPILTQIRSELKATYQRLQSARDAFWRRLEPEGPPSK